MGKTVLTTIRFAPEEARELKAYLRRNSAFSTISSLGRMATMEFIRTRTSLPLSPLPSGAGQVPRPWFLWDYDMSEAQVHELLRHAPFAQRKWLIARLLERLRPPEIFAYLSVEQIQQALPHVPMNPRFHRHWHEAIDVWTRPE